MNQDCVFCRIAAGEIPASKVYEDDNFIVFKDINPAAPVHLLAVPRKHIARLSEAEREDAALLGELLLTVGHVAREQNLESYRLIVNDGAGAGQTVFHLHAHILSGRQLGEKLL
jgi:histidine triad (HIT) family protein